MLLFEKQHFYVHEILKDLPMVAIYLFNYSF